MKEMPKKNSRRGVLRFLAVVKKIKEGNTYILKGHVRKDGEAPDIDNTATKDTGVDRG